MADYISSDGYGALYEKGKNRIVISLPPTDATATNTVEQTAKRKVDLTNADLMLMLALAKLIFRED